MKNPWNNWKVFLSTPLGSALFCSFHFLLFVSCLQKEGTTLLLADIFSTCFGWEPIKPIKETVLQPVNGSRIDPKFVNNPELSDVTFRWASWLDLLLFYQFFSLNSVEAISFNYTIFSLLWNSIFTSYRVESKIFYGHKIVLVTASPRLQSLLSSKVNEGNGTPTVQINDIRYHIFEVRLHSNLITFTNTPDCSIINATWLRI